MNGSLLGGFLEPSGFLRGGTACLAMLAFIGEEGDEATMVHLLRRGVGIKKGRKKRGGGEMQEISYGEVGRIHPV